MDEGNSSLIGLALFYDFVNCSLQWTAPFGAVCFLGQKKRREGVVSTDFAKGLSHATLPDGFG